MKTLSFAPRLLRLLLQYLPTAGERFEPARFGDAAEGVAARALERDGRYNYYA